MIFLLAAWWQLPAEAIFSRFTKVFFKPDPNIFNPGLINGINIMVLFYAAIVCAMVLWLLFKTVLRKHKHSPSLYSVLFSLCATMFFLHTAWQGVGTCRYLQDIFCAFASKTPEQKYSLFAREEYLFAQLCHRLLPGPHSAQFVFGQDVSRDPGMIKRNALAYFLYPIDIRDIRSEEKDSLIIYKHQDARALVPPNYTIIGLYNEDSVIAVKRETQEQ